MISIHMMGCIGNDSSTIDFQGRLTFLVDIESANLGVWYEQKNENKIKCIKHST